MKKLLKLLKRGFCWIGDQVFEFLMSFSEEDEEYEWKMLGAKCHLCGCWVPDAHPKGEFIVCDTCQQEKSEVN